MKKVIKRDGREVHYNKENIDKAVFNASYDVTSSKDKSKRVAEEISKKVEEHLKERYKKPTVEEIQDEIENQLMLSKYYDIAKAFILYRERQKMKREGDWLDGDLSTSIWQNKYQYANETIDEFFNRVSDGNDDIIKMMRGKYFCPAGRILANRSLQHDGKKVTFSNCYVNPKPQDNIESIFKSAAELARTFSYGGGVGIDITKLRPNGSKVNNAAKTTSGSCSFMELYDTTSKVIGQRGRRAALMISMSINHPDIEEFIDKKMDLDAVTKANTSIRIRDNFLKAVEKGETYEHIFYVNDTGEVIKKTNDARRIFNKITYNNWLMAEPGFLFWDRIESWNLLSEDENFSYGGVNPCAEQNLPENGACNLSSINLSEFVVNPFTEKAYFDYEKFEKYVKHGVVFLNNILDEGMYLHPLKAQQQSVKNWRQIGLGIMGLADMLIKLKIKYGSKKSVDVVHKIGRKMINAALQQSALLAKEHGTYPKYHKKAILKSDFLRKNADGETYRLILNHGLRNSQLLTIAPTGSISNMFGVSGGIEPIFALSYKRTTKTLHDKDQEYEIFTPIVQEYMTKHEIEDIDDLPEYFITSHNIPYKQRIDVQSAWQQYIDASISSTINLPNNATVQDVKDLYLYAWEKGLKGVTVYRDGCARSGILTTGETKKSEQLTHDDFIELNICPHCKADLKRTGGCIDCPNCGYSACSA